MAATLFERFRPGKRRNTFVGLATLAKTVLGLEEFWKSKKLAMSNWTRRPLSEKQVLYAARDAWVGPPLGLAVSKASATLAKPVARVRDDDERAGNENGNENANDDENLAAFESPSKQGSSSKEEGRSPPLRRLAVSPPRRPFAAANANAPADGDLPALVPGFASPDPEGSPGRATDPKPKKRARVLSRAPGPAAAKETRASPPRAAPRLAGGPVLVMVGDKAVAPAARDRSVNRRKPLSGRRAALPHGVVPMSPPKRVVRRTSNTLSRLWETETRR